MKLTPEQDDLIKAIHEKSQNLLNAIASCDDVETMKINTMAMVKTCAIIFANVYGSRGRDLLKEGIDAWFNDHDIMIAKNENPHPVPDLH